MFGKVFLSNIFKTSITTILFLCIAKGATDNVAHQPGIWSFNPQAIFIYKQPVNARKMYWYQMKNPMLSARQQSGNYPMKHRYRSAPIDMTPYASYRNMFRSPYHSSSAKGLLPYNIMSVPIPSTVAPIMAPSTWNFENKPQAVTVSENITSCKEELSQNPLAEGAVTIMPSENLKYSSNFFLNTMAPTTAIPYKQHSTHSFFTLDDVWIPQSSDSLFYNRDLKKPFVNNTYDQHITTTKIVPYDIPLGKAYRSLQLRTSVLPTVPSTPSTVLPTSTILPTRALSKIQKLKNLTLFANKTKLYEKINVALLNNAVINNKPSTVAYEPIMPTTVKPLLEENEIMINITPDICKSCLNNQFTKNDNTSKDIQMPKRHISTLKFKESLNSKSSEILASNLNITAVPKNIFKNLIAAKMNMTQRQERIRSMAKSLLASVPTVVSSTERTLPKYRRNKTIISRRRKLSNNIFSLNKLNTTTDKNSTDAKTPDVSPITEIINRKSKVMNNGINFLKTATTKKSKDPTTEISTTTQTIRTSDAAVESAIMTITSPNGKNVLRSIPRLRNVNFLKTNVLSPKDFARTTSVPELPIEVYFKKLNHN